MAEVRFGFKNVYCCCQMFLISHGIYLIAFHCLVQGAYGVGVVVTSSHKPENDVVNYTTIASNLCHIPTGIFLFWANLYESWKAARVAAVIVIMVTLFNITTTAMYFAAYVNFKANASWDKSYFHHNNSDWVGNKNFPFTLWHILAFILLFINLLWFYYAVMICRLSNYLRDKNT